MVHTASCVLVPVLLVYIMVLLWCILFLFVNSHLICSFNVFFNKLIDFCYFLILEVFVFESTNNNIYIYIYNHWVQFSPLE